MKTGIFTRKSALPIIMTTFLLILVTITITSAEVTELKVEPQEVDIGEEISITGEASPEEEVWISSSFELSLPVSDGNYSGEFNDIHFIRGEKVFSVTAENVKNVRASLYPVFWQTIEYPLEGPKTTTNGIATLSVSIDILSGKYDIEIYGDAADNATSVNLKVATSIKVIAESDGSFSLPINTEGVPEGEVLISAWGTDGGKKEKTVYIGVPAPSPTPSPTPTPTSNGEEEGEDGGGGSGSAAPETTPTPTPTTPENVTSNETTPTPTPTLIPTSTSASTTTAPQTTPIKTETGDKTPGPTPQNKTNQTPQETTEPTSIPGFGFEAIGCIAIAALIMVIMKMVLVYR